MDIEVNRLIEPQIWLQKHCVAQNVKLKLWRFVHRFGT